MQNGQSYNERKNKQVVMMIGIGIATRIMRGRRIRSKYESWGRSDVGEDELYTEIQRKNPGGKEYQAEILW